MKNSNGLWFLCGWFAACTMYTLVLAITTTLKG